MQAILFIGIQAAGKSTFYQQQFFATHIRLSLDMLKTRHREQLLLRACLEAKQPFVVDNTNTTLAKRGVYINAAKLPGFTSTVITFKPNPQWTRICRSWIEQSVAVPGAVATGLAQPLTD